MVGTVAAIFVVAILATKNFTYVKNQLEAEHYEIDNWNEDVHAVPVKCAPVEQQMENMPPPVPQQGCVPPPQQQGYMPPPTQQQGYMPPPPPSTQEGYMPPPPPAEVMQEQVLTSEGEQGYMPPLPPSEQQMQTPSACNEQLNTPQDEVVHE